LVLFHVASAERDGLESWAASASRYAHGTDLGEPRKKIARRVRENPTPRARNMADLLSIGAAALASTLRPPAC
jgi:hypothetical protein